MILTPWSVYHTVPVVLSVARDISRLERQTLKMKVTIAANNAIPQCDEVVPECTQCQRYGRACPGYRRTFRFQDEGPSLARRHRSTTRRKDTRDATSHITPSPNTPTTPDSQNSTEEGDSSAPTANLVRNNAIALSRHPSTHSLDETVSPSLVHQSIKTAQPQLFLDFISASFPTLYFHNRFRAGTDPGFAEYIGMNFGRDAYLDGAICCLSCVYLAHLTQDESLLHTSRRMYGASLRQVIRALSNPTQALSDNMLCTAMMLSVYEMYTQTRRGAWVVHADAVKRLMISRGTEAHKVGFGRSCWIAFRGFHVATAVYQGGPCFLDREEWREYALRIMDEDCRKPGEWSAYAMVSDRVFLEIVKCPRYISETRDLLLCGAMDLDRGRVDALIQCIQDTSRVLRALSSELRACIAAHSQHQQDIFRGTGAFVGPVPETFPETGPSLLLRGAESIQGILCQLGRCLGDGLRSRVVEELSPAESVVETPRSEGSEESMSSVSAKRLALPFRVHSELGRGPSPTSSLDNPQDVSRLDRVASSMGVLGTKLMTDEMNVNYGVEMEESEYSHDQ